MMERIDRPDQAANVMIPRHKDSRGREVRIGIIDCGGPFRAALRDALEAQPFSTTLIEGNVQRTTPSQVMPDIIVSSHAAWQHSAPTLCAPNDGQPGIPVLVIADQVLTSDVREILSLGAAGILLAETAAQHISWALPAISDGHRVVSPEISDAMISEYLASTIAAAQEGSARDRVHSLSHREQQVLSLVSRGMSNRAIASSLFISPETVKDHVRAICTKLKVANRVQAAHVAWLARTHEWRAACTADG
ncbi:response regulator transcription factor [Streptomyces thermocarboxydovorans]|uniref:Response regulator transcription factor n=1 Tax=Streptomyces thermocarboxydovorans TaxID=59298 RepID=A0ABN1HA25_9ACTN